MRILRHILGILSLLVGLALLGECAAHTMRSLWAQGIRQDLSLFLIKGAYFAPARHSGAYQILLGSGVLLTLLGVILSRAWALPFFLLGALCMAVLGGMTVERLVVPRGAEASLVQDGASGLGALFSQAYATGRIGDPAMLLGLGVFGLLTGLYLTHGLKPRPAPVKAGASPRSPARPAPSMESNPEEAATPEVPEFPEEPLPQEEEPRADTSVDPDLAPESPELDTSEVQAPEPLPPLEELPEASPEPEEPAPLPEQEMEMEAPNESNEPNEPEEPTPEPPAPAPPEGGLLFSGLSLACGVAAASSPAALFLLQIPEARLSLVWAGGTGLGLAGLGLGCLARPRRLAAKLGLGISGAGLLAGLALLGLGL